MAELTVRSESELEQTKKELKKYDYVRFSLCDLNGIYRGQVVSGRHVDSYLENGFDIFEGVLMTGPRTEMIWKKHEHCTNFGSMNMIPDITTLKPIPWSGTNGLTVGQFLCESYWKNGIPQAACPRYVARKQFKRLDDLGYQLYSGYELEFLLFHKDPPKPIYEGVQAYGVGKFSEMEDVIFEFDQKFSKAGVDVERYHVELDEGMYEAITSPKFGIESQDMILNMKEGLKEMAHKK